MNKTRKKTIGKLMRYVGRYWFLILISLLLSVVMVIANLEVPQITGDMIDFFGDLVKWKLSDGTEELIASFDINAIKDLALKMALFVAAGAVAQWLISMINNQICYKTAARIRKDAFDRLQVLPLSYLDGKPQGEIVNHIITDVDQVSDGLLMGFSQLFTSLFTILATLVLMLRINWIVAVLVVVLTPVSLFVASFIAKKTYRFFKDQSKIRGQQTALIDEMLANQKTVRTYGYEDKVQQRFDGLNDELKKTSLKAVFFSSLVNPTTRFANNVVYACVAVVGAFLVVAGKMTIGSMNVVLSYANQYTKPFNEISGVVTELQNAFACAERVFELIETEAQAEEPADAVTLTSPKGAVTINNVAFSYDPEKKLMENFNLQVEPGQRIAIVGPTGCGKTTLVNLLMRFYDVNSGEILVDGTDVRKLTRKSLRNAYGMVLQDVWVREGTILENLKLGNENATREEVIAAAKECHSHSFIKRLPQGYDTMIKEDGGSLSLGQMQLLCITRAMLSNPSMLILDEATSSIDTRTEIRIQKAFLKLMEGRTSFIVAHRLSTIREADRILVMKDGNIIESGTHEQLLAAGGFYKNLYESQ